MRLKRVTRLNIIIMQILIFIIFIITPKEQSVSCLFNEEALTIALHRLYYEKLIDTESDTLKVDFGNIQRIFMKNIQLDGKTFVLVDNNSKFNASRIQFLAQTQKEEHFYIHFKTLHSGVTHTGQLTFICEGNQLKLNSCCNVISSIE